MGAIKEGKDGKRNVKTEKEKERQAGEREERWGDAASRLCNVKSIIKTHWS